MKLASIVSVGKRQYNERNLCINKKGIEPNKETSIEEKGEKNTN